MALARPGERMYSWRFAMADFSRPIGHDKQRHGESKETQRTITKRETYSDACVLGLGRSSRDMCDDGT